MISSDARNRLDVIRCRLSTGCLVKKADVLVLSDVIMDQNILDSAYYRSSETNNTLHAVLSPSVLSTTFTQCIYAISVISSDARNRLDVNRCRLSTGCLVNSFFSTVLSLLRSSDHTDRLDASHRHWTCDETTDVQRHAWFLTVYTIILVMSYVSVVSAQLTFAEAECCMLGPVMSE